MVQELALLTWCDTCHLDDESKVSAELIKIPRTKDLRVALCDKCLYAYTPLLDAIQKLGITDDQVQAVKPQQRRQRSLALAVAPGLPRPDGDNRCPLPGCDDRGTVFTTSRGWAAHLLAKHPQQTFKCDVPGCGKYTCNMYQHYYTFHPDVPRAHWYSQQLKAVRDRPAAQDGQGALDVPDAT